VKAVIKIYSF